MWLHKLLNPHCPHCMELEREGRYNETVEVLKMQLALKTDECNKLMDRLLNPTTPVIQETKPVDITRPTRPVTWNIRKQMLESEDKKKAELLSKAPKPSDDIKDSDIEELEKELGVVGER